MFEVVYQAWHDTFVAKEGKTPRPPAGPSRRQRQIKELREEIKTLKRRWQDAGDEKRAALGEIRTEMRKRLIQLLRAETIREKQREKRRKRKAFFNNPFQFTADLLGKPKGGTLSCEKEEIENSVAAAHGDSSRCIPLGECPFQLPILSPHTPFNMANFTMDEVRAVVKKSTSGISPRTIRYHL